MEKYVLMLNSGLITKAIIEQIISADLTGSNPNVFYELAIRYFYRKPAIQIIKGVWRNYIRCDSIKV